ncbi:hypothetical protein ACF0H5_002857 [Mactra antiquata]
MANADGAVFVTKENICDSEFTKQFIADKLQKREDERLAHVQKRKEEKSAVSAAQENTKSFYEQFSKEKNDLENELSLCDSLDKNKLVDKFDEISVMYQKLQRFVTESTMFLPAYDLQQTQENLSKLQTSIQEKRNELIPKKKFAFKSKKKGTVSEKVEEKPKPVLEDEDVLLADCKFSDRNGEQLVMDSTINKKDVALTCLDSCIVKLHGTPSAVHINKLSNCTILSGPVSGSIFIRECKNCTFVVACQQLRIHTTTDTKFYIHVTSRAIIEDCSTVSFGPYNWTYDDIEKHYEMSGLDKRRNSWDDIDDFNWLAADKHSPNWSLIPEDDRKKFT